MAATATKRKIPYAYHAPGWKYESGNRQTLENSPTVLPDEYEKEMFGNLFCPSCKTNIERTPKTNDTFTNSRDPFFRHLQKWKHIACVLRAKKPEGKRYETWEEAKKAIDNEELSIISGFLQDKPIVTEEEPHEYDETPVEDIDGELSDVPIGRHQGESFKLPSKISTVAGICRNFEKNLNKYFYLPGAQHAKKLAELLTCVDELDRDILNTQQTPKLYYGKISESWNAGSRDTNTRMTRMQCSDHVSDFTLKIKNGFARDKGINNESVDRIVLFYGVISRNGGSIGVTDLAWGEIALLPKKYNNLLIPSLN